MRLVGSLLASLRGGRVVAVLLQSVLAALPGGPAAAEQVRFVPQLGLTGLLPSKVQFRPGDDKTLMVVNDSGRIDLFDVRNPDQPLKTLEIQVGAADATFNPSGDLIVSGGGDGTVRLWTLDGEAAVEPFRGHEDVVRSVAFHPSGELIVSGGDDGTVRLWTLDGEPAAEPFRGHKGVVRSVAFHPSGDLIVSGGDGTVRLWTLDGKPAAEPFDGKPRVNRSVAFNPAGDLIVSVGSTGLVELWTLDGELLPAPQLRSFSVAFNPTGDRIVSGGSDGTVRLWTLDGRQAAEPFHGHENDVRSVAVNSTGDMIVSGGRDGTVRFWTVGVEPAAKSILAHRVLAESVAFNPAGDLIVSGGWDDLVRLWTLDGEPAAKPFIGHEGWVFSVAFNPSGDLIVSGGHDGTIRLWTLDGEPVAEPFRGHEGWVESIAFHPSGNLIVSGGWDGTVRLWTLDGKPAAEPFRGHGDEVRSVAFNPSGDLIVSGGGGGTVRLWTLDGAPAAKPLPGHERWVESVTFNPSGDRIVSFSEDGTVRLWTLDGELAGEPLRGHEGEIKCVALNPFGDRIVSFGNDGIVRLWTLDGEPAVELFRGDSKGTCRAAFNPSGDRIVSGNAGGTVQLWTLTGRPVAEPIRGRESEIAEPSLWHESWVDRVSFNAVGNRIVSGGEDGALRLWALDDEPVAKPFRGHEGEVWSVAFNPTGDLIVSGGGDETVRLWTLDGEPAAEPFRGHEGDVRSVAFNPSGDLIVSGDGYGAIRLWTLDGKPAAKPFQGHKREVLSVAFSASGDLIVSGGDDGTVRLWNAAGRAIRSLSICPGRVHVLAERGFAVACSDRIVVLDPELKPLGQLFLLRDGLVILTDEGAWAPTDELQLLVRAFGEDGTLLTRLGAVPDLPLTRVRQIFLDQWTALERIENAAYSSYGAVREIYAGLGWWRVPFWPALGWALAVLSALIVWVFVPARLAHWAMPVTGAPPPPPWKWLLGVITFYGWLGVTRRPLKAWLRRHRAALESACFTARDPVEQRLRYSPLGQGQEIADFAAAIKARHHSLIWIDGVGGSGKSATAFHLVRVALVGAPKTPVPVLVDEDWTGSLAFQVAEQLRLPEWDRRPTEAMVKTLGAAGLICPLVDSLSERSMTDADKRVGEAASEGHFRHLVVTARRPPPQGQVWEGVSRVSTRPLEPSDVPAFIAAYVPEERRKETSGRVAPLVETPPMPSPLFLRFAIEQALQGPLGSTARLDLVLRYVETLRAGKVDLNADDMLRAGAIAAVESVRDSLVPREVEQLHLRGVLVKGTDEASFLDAGNTDAVEPAAVIEMLVSAGLLNRNRANRRLQFSYDPVAEYLAAWHLNAAGAASLGELKNRILKAKDSPIAEVLKEIADDTPQPAHSA